MANEQHRQHASDLHALIIGASARAAWSGESNSLEHLPPWQLDVLSKILTLTFNQEIEYLSTAMPEDDDWDIIAFTELAVVRVAITRVDGETVHTETSTFARSSLESLELIDVAPIPAGDDIWPAELNLIGHYRSATITLPLDKFASRDNKRELVRLLSSLLSDVGQ